jgi:hypothetical protein
MHEVLLTRGDVQGCSEKVRNWIMVPSNCVLVHHGPCHLIAVTENGKKKCIMHLIEHEGYNEISLWLRVMERVMKSRQPQWALNLVTEVWNEMQDLSEGHREAQVT